MIPRRCKAKVICGGFIVAGSLALLPVAAQAQELDVEKIFDERNLAPVKRLLDVGDYDLCSRICLAAIQQDKPSVEWRLIGIKALVAMGDIDAALETCAGATTRFPNELSVLILQHEVASKYGRTELAKKSLDAVNQAARVKPAKDRTVMDYVALGKAALALGADAQKVLTQYYDPAKKKDPKDEEPYLAAGQLALDKQDFARAAEEFRLGLKEHGETANLRSGLAQAYAPGDREKSVDNIRRAVEINPRHEGAMLLNAELLINAEKYLEAEAAIQSVLDTNGRSAEAWALRAAIAEILADPAKAASAREEAMKDWTQNPAVDQIIGRCLLRAYRFAEAAEHQRAALKLDPKYLPAKVQLCHALLRLGDEEQAWKLAGEIRDADGYNVQAHNLGLLETEMAAHARKEFEDFIIVLPSREWDVYGARALELLREARQQLAGKYGMVWKRPVLVEFFPSQQDFAIRTFGHLGGQGMLGACFGSVMTLNSPGSLAHGRSNWESTLWHEFCHVVTLTATHNRMPRWLSEGISVYEEAQRDPAWGMKMSAKFRKMIVEDESLVPMSELSSAFLNADSSDKLMFAYFESSQAVDFLVSFHGEEKFKDVLRDLAAGKRINDALSDNIEPIERLEKDFEIHMLTRVVKSYGEKVDWTAPEPEEVNPLEPQSLSEFLAKRPNNHWALERRASDLIDDESWEKAAEVAQKLIDLFPEDTSGEGAYAMKAMIMRKMGRTNEEIELLRKVAAGSADSMDVYLRLIELDSEAGRWKEVLASASRATALNPFLKSPQAAIAKALEATGDNTGAIAAYRRLLALDPDNPSETRFRLAALLRTNNKEEAKRHLLDALVLAPRFREAHQLLLEMEDVPKP